MTSRGASTIGGLLDATFTAYRKHAAILVPTAAAVFLPAMLMAIQGGGARGPVRTLIGLLATVVMTAQASDALLGRSPTVLRALGVGVRRFVPALLCLSFLAVTGAAATLPFAALAWLARPRFSGFTPAAFVGAIIALAVLWGAVMSLLILRYFALIPVVALEPGASPPDRSIALARGAYGRIALVWLIGGLIYGVPMVLVGGAQGLVVAMQDRGHAPLPLVVLIAVLVWIASSIVGPFSTMLNTALYHDQRARLGDPAAQAEPAGLEIGGGGSAVLRHRAGEVTGDGSRHSSLYCCEAARSSRATRSRSAAGRWTFTCAP
jgi:hypothetical protein